MSTPTIADLMNRINDISAGMGGIRDTVGEISSMRPSLTPQKVFGDMLTKSKGINGGFENFSQFAHTVRACSNNNAAPQGWGTRAKGLMDKWLGEVDNRNRANDWGPNTKANSPTGMAEGFTGADGGYLVPPEFAANVLMRTYGNDLLSRTTVMPIGGNSIKIPAIDETSRADGSRFGGVQAYWRREASSVTNTKPKINDVNLDLESLMLMIRCSDEILQDTGGVLETFLSTVAAQELTFKTGDAIVNGDGVGKPLGIMNAPAKVTQAAESGQAASTIVAANVINMYSRLHVSALPNAVWLYDQSILPQLMQMTIGSAGAQLVQWVPPGGLSAAPYGMLMGRPMIWVEFCQQLGTEGDLILWDPTQYLTATKGGVQTAVSMHLYFDTNEMAFRFVLRLDGKPWWIKALTPKSGGPTQSCIVTLATRS